MRLESLVADLRSDLSHERKLRTRLEESQRTLTQHVHDMEVAVELEKEQVSRRNLFSFARFILQMSLSPPFSQFCSRL